MISTQMIVLAKQPYKEAALLLSGLSPDYGRLNLVANGAQKLSEKKFPAADLFRELEVEFNEEGASDLFTAKQLELAAAFDALADNPKHFQLAGRIGSFLLKNAVPAVPQPLTYDALRCILDQLSRPPMRRSGGPWNSVRSSSVRPTFMRTACCRKCRARGRAISSKISWPPASNVRRCPNAGPTTGRR